jgi:uncharacterized RDD family membrane protein YckC
MWWYAGASGRMGPVPENELIGLVQRGVVSGATLVWREGMANWQAMATQPQFIALFAPGAPAMATAPSIAPMGQKPATWYRYFARSIDMTVIIFVVIFVVVLGVSIVLAAAGQGEAAGVFIGLMTIAAFLALPVFEAILAKLFGNTPGKALFGLKPVRADGQPMTFGNLIGRNYRAYFFGMGLGMPIISLVMLIVQFNNVRSKGTTGYDSGRYIMTETPLSTGRKIAAISVLVLVVLLLVGSNLVPRGSMR